MTKTMDLYVSTGPSRWVSATSIGRARWLLSQRYGGRDESVASVRLVTARRVRVAYENSDRLGYMRPRDLADYWPDQIIPEVG